LGTQCWKRKHQTKEQGMQRLKKGREKGRLPLPIKRGTVTKERIGLRFLTTIRQKKTRRGRGCFGRRRKGWEEKKTGVAGALGHKYHQKRKVATISSPSSDARGGFGGAPLGGVATPRRPLRRMGVRNKRRMIIRAGGCSNAKRKEKPDDTVREPAGGGKGNQVPSCVLGKSR